MMQSGAIKKWLLPAIILIVGFSVIVPVSGYVERSRPPLPADYEDSDLTIHGARLKGYLLGMDGLIADWYWIRSLQYIGNKILNARPGTINIDDLSDLNPRLLYPYLDNATDLDPHFLDPYSYGALVLPAIDSDKAILIAQKGINNNPNEWRLYQHLGYIYWKLGQYDKAAAIYERGSRIPSAAPFMKLMAASMQNKGGDRETARQIFKQMLVDENDPQVRITAESRLKEIESFDERDAIEKILSDYQARIGHCVTDLSEIIPALGKIHLPDNNDFQIDNHRRLVDPTGAPYLLDQEQCKVKVDLEHTGLPTK